MKGRLMKGFIGSGLALVALACVFVAFQNCAGGGFEPRNSTEPIADSGKLATPAEIERLTRLVQEAAARELSCSGDGDCLVIGVGTRPCGGPNEYVVTSKSNDVEEIESLNSDLTDVQGRYFSESQVVGTCEFMVPPTALCKSNRCEAGPADPNAI